MKDDGYLADGKTVCDCGCGTGSLAIPMAEQGATVYASDISQGMVDSSKERATASGVADKCVFTQSDLESVEGSYDVVTCLDVLIHYPKASSTSRFS